MCGEIFGGLPTPRLPSERREGGVFASDGGDVTDAFRRGAEEVGASGPGVTGAQAAILKERSPSCGSGEIYDGTFTGTVVEGWGRDGGSCCAGRASRCWGSPGWENC